MIGTLHVFMMQNTYTYTPTKMPPALHTNLFVTSQRNNGSYIKNTL